MTDTELKSCIGTIEMLRRLHGVMNVIDAGNCEKIIKVLSDILKYKDAYNKGWDDGAKATYEHLKMCEEEQESCEDEYIKVPKKALKYRTAGMVAYNVEWLKNHFDIERTVICGVQESTDTWSIKDVADTFKKHGLIREQEPCDDANANQRNSNALNALEGDAISRQAVIDIIHLFFTEEVDKIPTKKTDDGEVLVIHKCQPLFEMNKAICKRIKALPSVFPTQNCVGNALDCVSRQAVLEYIEGSEAELGHSSENDLVCQYIKELPPVKAEPKTGHWITQWNVAHQKEYYYCSECREEFSYDGETGIKMNDYDFCPNCGCRMVEPQESEE